MISLQNINIKYNENLIENGTMLIPNHAIVAISGKSGAGKTSILYRLGLVSISEDYDYRLDGEKLNLSDKKMISKIQQNHFGFLFQEGSMVDSLTVEENIHLAAGTAGMNLSKEEMIELLDSVELSEEKLSFYPQKLSGGERQRASLAIILAKKSKYILADEPTASLDKENADKIIQIFMKLKALGYTIVVSTHSKEVLDSADVVYNIENKRIICVKGESVIKQMVKQNENMPTLKDNIKGKTIFWYARHSKKKGKFLNALLIFFCAIGISGFAITNNIMGYLMQTQEELLHRLSDREIYSVNQSTSADGTILDADGNLILEDKIIEQIVAMDGVDKVYEMIEWRSFALSNEEIRVGSSIHVATSTSNYTVDYSIEKPECDYFVALPYFEEQQLEKQLYAQYGEAENNGVYLSYDIAEELGLLDKSLDELELKFEIGIPVYKLICKNDDTAEAENDMDIVEFTTLNVKVNGILNDNVTNRYTINGNSVIYMPHGYMKNVMDKFSATYDYSNYLENQLVKWSPSALVVYADSYKNVNILKQKIENVTSNMVTRYDYQDTESLEDLMQNLKNVTNLIIGIVLFIIFALMCAIYVSGTVSRKREYAILKANGFTGSNLRDITTIESLFQAGKILIISLVISCFLTAALCVMLLGQMKFITIETIVCVVIFSVIFVIIPSLISILYINTLKVEKIIRN